MKTSTVEIRPVNYCTYLSLPCSSVPHMATARVLYWVRSFDFGHGEVRLVNILLHWPFTLFPTCSLHVGNRLYIMLDLLIFDGITFKCA